MKEQKAAAPAGMPGMPGGMPAMPGGMPGMPPGMDMGGMMDTIMSNPQMRNMAESMMQNPQYQQMMQNMMGSKYTSFYPLEQNWKYSNKVWECHHHQKELEQCRIWLLLWAE